MLYLIYSIPLCTLILCVSYILGIPIADRYYALLIRAQGTLTSLQADFNDFPLTSQIPSLNIQTKVKPPLPMPSQLPMTNKPMTLA